MVPVRIQVMNMSTLHRFTLQGWRMDHRRIKTWMGIVDTVTKRCDAMAELVYIGVEHAAS